MAPKIGSFLTKYGTEGNDYPFDIKSGDWYLGYGGDDRLNPLTIEYLIINNAPYIIPAIISGGYGDDLYSIHPSGNIIIADNSTSNKDYLSLVELYANDIETLFTIDGRHLFVQAGKRRYGISTNLLILDALNSQGAIEIIEFKDIKFSGDPQSIDKLISTYKTKNNQSLDAFLASGYLNPKAIGLNLSEVADMISTLTVAGNQALATYLLTPSSYKISEGSILTTSLTVTNVPAERTLYYSLTGNGITSQDFISGNLTESVYIYAVQPGSSQSYSIWHILANDLITEGDESLQIKLFSDAARTIQVGSTVTVSITDTSFTATPTYTLTPSATNINEGSTLTTSVTTTNTLSGTTLYYSLSGTGINTSDFSAGSLTGSGTITSNGTFSFSHTLTNDLTTEGTETLNIKLFSDSSLSTQVGSTATVSIADTSTTLGIPTARTVDNLYAKALIAGPLLQTNIVGNQIDYQFYNIGAERYGIKQKESTRIDEITGLASISISGTTISISQDIQGVFDQVTGRETQDAQAFRLYNAAFARFPDSSGLRYWINEYKSGISNYRTIAQSFINSNEFALRYGANNSNEEFINNMYKNVLGRLPDASGLAYWVGNLNSGADSRVNVLGGFSESAENKILFSQGTGFI